MSNEQVIGAMLIATIVIIIRMLSNWNKYVIVVNLLAFCILELMAFIFIMGIKLIVG